jgi:hypothetical protein
MVDEAATLPYTFVLEIEPIEFRVGCEVRHRHHGSIGVHFISLDLVNEVGPIWSIDELMSRAAEALLRKAE